MKARVFKMGSRSLGEVDLANQLDELKMSDTIQPIIIVGKSGTTTKIELNDSGQIIATAVTRLTVPVHETWELFLLTGIISTSAVVGSRAGTLGITPALAGIPGCRARNTVDVIASQLGSIFLDPLTGKEFVLENGVAAAETTTVFNRHLVTGDEIRFTITGIAAGDITELLAYIRRSTV